MSRLSICFVAPQAMPALLQELEPARAAATPGGSSMGGAELQQVMVGRELARRGHRVTMVAGAPDRSWEGQPGVTSSLRVITFPSGPSPPAPEEGERGVRKGWRLARGAAALFRALDRAAAEIYVARSNHLNAALVAGWCRLTGSSFVFASGHDGNCDLALAHRRPRRAVALSYRAALRGAAGVVVQSEAQRFLMAENFRLRAETIPSAIPLHHPAAARHRRGVLWVGTLEPRKGPDRYLDLAGQLPGVEFKMVGGNGTDPGYAGAIRSRAAAMPNVRFIGALDHAATLAEFEQCTFFLSTSRSEGFPNTFLEAWSRGAPVVSLHIDPDGCLQRDGLGLLVRDEWRAAPAILDLMGDPRRRDEMARAARRHVETRHGLEVIARRWESFLQSVMDEAGRPGPGLRWRAGAA